MSENSDGHQGTSSGGPNNNNNESGGGHNNRSGQHGRRSGQGQSHRDDQFKGEADSLKGFYYDVSGPKMGETFAKVTERIGRHVVTELDVDPAYQNGLSELSLPIITAPVKPQRLTDGSYDELDMADYKADRDEHKKDLKQRKLDEGKVFAVIIGQCTPTMKDRIHTETDWPRVKVDTDTIALLKIIQAQSNTKVKGREPAHALFEAIKDLVLYKQGGLSMDKYQEEFEARLAKLELAGGRIGTTREYVDSVIRLDRGHNYNPTHAERAAMADTCRNKLLATIFMLNAGKNYNPAKLAIENAFTINKGSENPYPNNIAEARDKLMMYKAPNVGVGRNDQTNVTFLNDANEDGGGTTRPRNRGRGGGRGGGGRGGAGQRDGAGGGRGHPHATPGGTDGTHTSNSANDTNSSVNA
mmetsp:Transcript_23769/g.34048  ORF Transcript_23769/g.34048 Transcript_23769/m.34048 type:complete len:413 (+) Transcript_23769:112-1350(+)